MTGFPTSLSPSVAMQFERNARFEAFDAHRAPVLRWHPRGKVRAHAVFFPPFGDEMNQSRRMFRLAAEALASRGIACCVFDLLGTGDSSADFSEATVSAWLADTRRVLATTKSSDLPVVLIGCRLGVALAAQASDCLPRPARLLVGWAPLLQGGQQLSSLLRAAKFARLNGANAPDPKAQWAAGKVAWLAGYPFSPVLAQQLMTLDARGAPNAERCVLFELRALQQEQEASPVASETLRHRAESWTREGVTTETIVSAGPAFWNVADLVDVPGLIEATVTAVVDATQSDARSGRVAKATEPI